MSKTKRERLADHLAQLEQARQSWEPAWADIGEHIAPYRVRINQAASHYRNRGDRRKSKIINNVPVLALRVQVSGLMFGITSPTRKWFGLAADDPELAEDHEVKVYLDDVQRILEQAFHESNLYEQLTSGVYPDLGSVATSAMFEEEGKEPGSLVFTSIPIGEYYLDIGYDGKVNTFFRKFARSASQLEEKFGLDVLSPKARMAIKDNKGSQYQSDIVHAIYPNPDHRRDELGPGGMAWLSDWWELGSEDPNAFLRESGYEEFPILAPRWKTDSGDVYGRGPGWDVLEDCMGLQHLEGKKLRMIDKTVAPPMKASDSVKRGSLLPGDRTNIGSDGTGIYEPAITINPHSIEQCRLEIEENKARIEQGMYTHLWQQFLTDDRNERQTATEVEVKEQEKLLQLGPLLESLDGGLLEPLIKRTFAILARAGRLPEPPEEMLQTKIKINFVSILHQAQQATGLGAVRTLVQEIANLAQLKPDVLDKIDLDAVADEIARITGVRPDTMVSDDEVEEIREARARAEAAQREGEALLSATEGAKNLQGADPQQLSDVMGMLSPAAAAQGGGLP